MISGVGQRWWLTNSLRLPGNFALIDIKAPLWHVAHAPLGLLAGKGVQKVNIGSLICDFKVTDAAITLWGYKQVFNFCSVQIKLRLYNNVWFNYWMLKKEVHLPTEVNNVGVCVIEGQKHSIAGVHLIDSHWLLHVLLENKNKRLN